MWYALSVFVDIIGFRAENYNGVSVCLCVCEQHLCVCVCLFASSLCVLERPAARAVFYMCVPHVIARMRVTPVSDVFKFGSSF